MTDPMAGLPARSCNDPEHNEARSDAEHGTPCLVCGAPILNGYGHDRGCMVPQRDEDAELARAEEYGWAL